MIRESDDRDVKANVRKQIQRSFGGKERALRMTTLCKRRSDQPITKSPDVLGASKPLECNVSEADQITELLKSAKNIAVVGLSNNPMRAAFGVSAYLQSQGYRIIPVNPNADVVLGEKAYPSLLDVPHHIDVVDIFRRSEFVEPIVDAAIKKGTRAVWMQETVINEPAAQKARDHGIFVVMDRCILKEHRKRNH
jgi:uncharacterized protein